jgi:dolichol-phosphate mannosyltransferase
MDKLSIIIPVYYNEDTIMDCYLDLKNTVLDGLPDYELILVDDGSGDNSWQVMNEIAKLDGKIKLLKLSRNFGSHAAIYAGISVCSGDCATIKSADSQEPPDVIYKMYESWKQGNKVVLAARSDRKEGLSTKLFADLYYYLVRRIVNKKMPKGGFDCYLIDRKVIEVLKLMDEKNSAVTLQILWSGFKTSKVYYVRESRKFGRSRWTLTKKIKLVVDSIVGFSFVPIRLMTSFGVLFFIISILWAIALIISRLLNQVPVEGWTTLMVVVLFSSGIIMLSLGILGEYIWRTFDAARNRPVFVVEEIDKEIA